MDVYIMWVFLPYKLAMPVENGDRGIEGGGEIVVRGWGGNTEGKSGLEQRAREK